MVLHALNFWRQVLPLNRRLPRIFSRLFLSFAVLLVIVMGAVLVLFEYSVNAHHEESTQLLHQELAQYIVDHNLPLLKQGEMEPAAVKSLFSALMMTSPATELYILDPDGKVVSYDAEPGVVKRLYVDMAPLQQYLSGTAQFPVKGDDPRSLGEQKIFSVAPIANKQGQAEGYLYIILGGQEYDSIVSRLQNSHIARSTLIGLAAVLLLSLIGAFITSHLISRPITLLTQQISQFKEQANTLPDGPDFHEPTTRELHELTTAFDSMAQRISEQLQQMQHTDVLRRQLIAHVSHDLRTPLASVTGYLETWTLKHRSLSEEEGETLVKTALRQCHKLESMISELFELARLDAGDVRLEQEKFSVAELASDVIQKLSVLAEKKSIALDSEVATSLPSVVGDIGRIERAMTNLLENSLRYTPPGGTVTLSIKNVLSDQNVSGKEHPRIRIAVKDTGPGIPSEDIPYLFEPYFRSNQHLGTDKNSTGLGLAITKRIVELHQSHIEIESTPGEGAMFWFELQAA